MHIIIKKVIINIYTFNLDDGFFDNVALPFFGDKSPYGLATNKALSAAA